MWNCPVCQKENDGVICDLCGFDSSMDYEKYPSLCFVSGKSVSARRAERECVGKQYYRCPLQRPFRPGSKHRRRCAGRHLPALFRILILNPGPLQGGRSA